MVRSDGRWVVTHIDEDNPDCGRPVEHFFNDHPAGKFLKAAGAVALVTAGVVGAAALIGSAIEALEA